MKIKYIILLILSLFICGCTTTKEDSIDNITSRLSSKISEANTYHTGYKYLLPNSMKVTNYMLYNDIIEDNKYTYYLFADVISYFNKNKLEYVKNENAYYSDVFDNGKKFGYIEINLNDNNQYLIEIMYNYAKIEVMVDDDDFINDALTNATTILRSVQYNDDVISNLLGEDVLTFQEEEYDVFNKVTGESNYLKRIEDEYTDEDTGNTGKVKDTDLLN